MGHDLPSRKACHRGNHLIFTTDGEAVFEHGRKHMPQFIHVRFAANDR